MPRGIRAAKAFVEVFFEKTGLKRGFAWMQATAARAAKGMRTLGGMGLKAGAGLAGAFIFPVKAASDLQEVMNKFDTVFGDQKAAMKRWGDEFAGQVGRSKRQVAEFLASNQDLLVPIGFDSKSASVVSKEITKLAIDLASFNNMSDADVQRDLQAALTGSGEVMKKYGVIVSQAAVNQRLLDDGINPKSATEAQKTMARFNLILDGTTQAQGDAMRSAGSWANQQKRLLALLEDFAAEVGGPVLEVLTPFLKRAGDIVSRMAEWAQANPGLVKTIVMVTGAILGVSAALFGLGMVLPAIATGLALVFSPMGLLVGVTAGLAVGLVKLSRSGGMVGRVMDWLKDRFGPLLDIAKRVFEGIKDALNSGDYALAAKLLWLGLKAAWLEGTKELRDKIREFKKFFIEMWHEMATEAKKKLTGLQGTAASVFSYVIAVFSGLDTDEVQKTLEEDTANRVKKISDQHDEDAADRNKEYEKELADATGEIAKVRAEMNEALAKAKEKAVRPNPESKQLDKAQKDVAEKLDEVQEALASGQVAQKLKGSTSDGVTDLKSVAGAQVLIGLANKDQAAEAVREMHADNKRFWREWIREQKKQPKKGKV